MPEVHKCLTAGKPGSTHLAELSRLEPVLHHLMTR